MKTLYQTVKLITVIGLFLISSRLFSQTLNDAIKLTTSEQFEAAEAAYKNLIQKFPAAGDNYYYFGENFLKEYFTDSATSDFKEYASKALEQFKKGTEVDPLNPINYIGLGKIALFENKFSEAQADFTKALSFLPKRPQKRGPYTPERYALILTKIADAYIKAPVIDTNQTFPYLRRALDIDPADPSVYITMGDAFLEINDGSNAIIYYKKAQEFDKTSPIAILRIGQLWLRAKNYNDALFYYKQAISVDSTFAPAYWELGDLYSLARMYPEAVKSYKKFLNISPNNITAKVRYAQNLYKAREYQEAVDVIQDVYRQDSTSFNILNRVAGYSYYELNQLDKAQKYIDRFIRNSKAEKLIVSDWMYYGKILLKNKMDSLAIEKFKKAYKMDTTNLEVLSFMATAYNNLKKYNEAASMYQKKIDAGSSNPYDIISMGKAYYNAQNWKMADTTFALYIKNQPQSIQGYYWRALTNANEDPDSRLGKAKPYFEELIKVAIRDSVKNKNELLQAYDYLRFYYFKQYNMKKLPADKENSILYCEKILAINPENQTAKDTLKAFKKIR